MVMMEFTTLFSFSLELYALPSPRGGLLPLPPAEPPPWYPLFVLFAMPCLHAHSWLHLTLLVARLPPPVFLALSALPPAHFTAFSRHFTAQITPFFPPLFPLIMVALASVGLALRPFIPDFSIFHTPTPDHQLCPFLRPLPFPVTARYLLLPFRFPHTFLSSTWPFLSVTWPFSSLPVPRSSCYTTFSFTPCPKPPVTSHNSVSLPLLCTMSTTLPNKPSTAWTSDDWDSHAIGPKVYVTARGTHASQGLPQLTPDVVRAVIVTAIRHHVRYGTASEALFKPASIQHVETFKSKTPGNAGTLITTYSITFVPSSEAHNPDHFREQVNLFVLQEWTHHTADNLVHPGLSAPEPPSSLSWARYLRFFLPGCNCPHESAFGILAGLPATITDSPRGLQHLTRRLYATLQPYLPQAEYPTIGRFLDNLGIRKGVFKSSAKTNRRSIRAFYVSASSIGVWKHFCDAADVYSSDKGTPLTLYGAPTFYLPFPTTDADKDATFSKLQSLEQAYSNQCLSLDLPNLVSPLLPEHEAAIQSLSHVKVLHPAFQLTSPTPTAYTIIFYADTLTATLTAANIATTLPGFPIAALRPSFAAAARPPAQGSTPRRSVNFANTHLKSLDLLISGFRPDDSAPSAKRTRDGDGAAAAADWTTVPSRRSTTTSSIPASSPATSSPSSKKPKAPTLLDTPQRTSTPSAPPVSPPMNSTNSTAAHADDTTTDDDADVQSETLLEPPETAHDFSQSTELELASLWDYLKAKYPARLDDFNDLTLSLAEGEDPAQLRHRIDEWASANHE